MSRYGFLRMRSRSLNVAGSPSAALHTTYLGPVPVCSAVHFRAVGNPAPPRPRSPDRATSSTLPRQTNPPRTPGAPSLEPTSDPSSVSVGEATLSLAEGDPGSPDSPLGDPGASSDLEDRGVGAKNRDVDLGLGANRGCGGLRGRPLRLGPLRSPIRSVFD